MSHLDRGLLHSLIDGEIPSSELVPIQAHLTTCEACRAALEHERQLQTDVDGLVDLIEPPATTAQSIARNRARSPRFLRPSQLAWAATVVMAAGLGYIVRGNRVPVVNHEGATAALSPPTMAAVRQVPRIDSGAALTSPQAAPPRSRPATPSHPATPPPPPQGAITADASGAPATATLQSRAAAPASNPAGDRPEAAAKAASESRTNDNARLANSLVPRDFIAARRDSTTPTVPITFPDAMARLGGTIRLIDGIAPVRLELREPYVRVVYPSGFGELVLQQQLIDGRVQFQLVAPRGFPADSLAHLREKIRE